MLLNKNYLLLFIAIVFCCGCDRFTVGIRMKRFLSNPVVFPDSFVRIDGTSESRSVLSMAKARLVVYIDSSSCSSCNLNRLARFSQYAALSRTDPEFEMIVLLWPDSETRLMVENDIDHRNFPFDVFVDYDGSFSESNPNHPGRDVRFNCFLIDEKNVPVMVGDPTSGKHIESLFKEQYNKLSHSN